MAGAPNTLLNGIYRTFFQRNAAMLFTVFSGAFALQLAYDTGADKIWDNINRGRQWKDIKHKYITKPEDDEDDE